MRRVFAFLLILALLGTVCALSETETEQNIPEDALLLQELISEGDGLIPQEEAVAEDENGLAPDAVLMSGFMSSGAETVSEGVGMLPEEENVSEGIIPKEENVSENVETVPEDETASEGMLPKEEIPSEKIIPKEENAPKGEEIVPEEAVVSEPEEILTEESVEEIAEADGLLQANPQPAPEYTFELPNSVDLKDGSTFTMKISVQNFIEGDQLKVSANSANGFRLKNQSGSVSYSLNGLDGVYTADTTDEITVSYKLPGEIYQGTLTDTLTFTFQLKTANRA